MPATEPIVDLRSDTVTRPSPAMREAMAGADVGDDVFGEDPTVNALQSRAAEITGKEAALFVPSGTMANQVALLTHCRPGDDVIIGHGAHNYFYESGGGGALAGIQFTVVGSSGLFEVSEAEAAIKPDNHHHAPTRLLCVENTQNQGGGLVWPVDHLEALVAMARRNCLRTHLDGARVFNAAVASGVPVDVLAAEFDTVSFCLSKGLGAPVGSVLCGDAETIHRAHRYRKMLGGGMRQAGVIAAAGLYALEHNVDRLADDHDNARRLADGLVDAGVDLDPNTVETNIISFPLRNAEAFAEGCRQQGVLLLALAPTQVRAVTHRDVSAAGIDRAVKVARSVLRASRR